MYMKGYILPAQLGLMVMWGSRREESFICQTGNNKRSTFWEEGRFGYPFGKDGDSEGVQHSHLFLGGKGCSGLGIPILASLVLALAFCFFALLFSFEHLMIPAIVFRFCLIKRVFVFI